MMASRVTRFLLLVLVLFLPSPDTKAQETEDSAATTEFSCGFSVEQGETGRPCQVPFPQGCLVASIPGTTQPWTTISKGGRVQCRFDEKATDWKTNIVGACGRCRSVRCSVHFSVRFDCSAQH
jgi:hypothetical protein